MRKLLLAALFLFATRAHAIDITGTSGSASTLAAAVACTGSSLNIDGGTLYVDCSNNRVGMGYTTPRTTLDMGTGGILMVSSGSAANPAVRFEGHASGLMTNAASTLDVVAGGSQMIRVNTSGASMLSGTFQAASGGASGGLITTDGDTSAPSLRFTNALTTGLMRTGPGAATNQFQAVAGGETQQVWNASGTVVYENLTAVTTVTVQGNAFSVGVSTLVVTGGNVGIGTTSPEQKLHVSLAGADPTSILQVAAERTAYGNVRGQIRTYAGGSTSTDKMTLTVDSGDIVLDSGGSVDGLVLKHSGNVGIGTTGPATKLHLSSGTVRIDGSGAPTTGAALCLSASGTLSTCSSAVGVDGTCTCN